MFKHMAFFAAISAVLIAAVTTTARAADWPNFRGPNHDGISAESSLKTEWESAIPMKWERTLGSAFSSFAVVDGRLYTCGTKNKQQVLYCLKADTGDTIWETPIEAEFKDNFGDGTRATPTVADGKVYILGALGRLLCVKADDGSVVWSHQFSEKPQWAYSGSVLVEGGLAIASGGGKHGALAAFDMNTGDQKWKVGNDPVGYATPYPFTFEGTRYVAGFTGTSMVIAELQTGKQALREKWKTDWQVNAAAPIYHDGHLFMGSGYKTGSALFKLSRRGDDLRTDRVWMEDKFLLKFQSAVLANGHLFASDQKSLKCVDFATGAEKWSVPRIKDSTVVLAGDSLVVLTEGGELQIGPASPAGWNPTTKANLLSGKCWSVPVLVGGDLYVRNLSTVKAFDVTP